MPGDFEQPLAEEEHHSGIVRRAELPGDGQAQDVAVEATAAVQVAGAQEDPAAQNVHATISASRLVTKEVNENAHSAADLVGDLILGMAVRAQPEPGIMRAARLGSLAQWPRHWCGERARALAAMLGGTGMVGDREQ